MSLKILPTSNIRLILRAASSRRSQHRSSARTMGSVHPLNIPYQNSRKNVTTRFLSASSAMSVADPIDKRVLNHLEEVLRIMNQKEALKKKSDFKDPSYEGAVAEFPCLRGYLIKLGAEERIRGGDLLRKCIVERGLNLLRIPDQIPFCIPQSYHSMTSLRMLAICAKIEGVQGRSIMISFKKVEQLISLVKETGAGDLRWRNLVHSSDGTIALIDTECFWGRRLGLLSLLEHNSFDERGADLLRHEIRKIDTCYR